MSNEDLFAIVIPWYETGSLDEALKPQIQAFHMNLTGDTGERCRTCKNYWSDVLHDLRVYLKSQGFQLMENNQEYMIRKDQAYLQVHGLPYVYINKGSGKESDSAKYLTDKIAVDLLKEYPDLAEVIVKVEKQEAASADTPAATSTGLPAKPKTAAKPRSRAKPNASTETKTVPIPTAPLEADKKPNDSEVETGNPNT